jgi:hypothetical protein
MMGEGWFSGLKQYSPAAICRLDACLMSGLAARAEQARLCAAALVALCAGTAAYGYSFGAWRDPAQAFYSAAKMPLLFISVALVSGLINFMLARLLGARLTLRQTLMAVLIGMAITALILGALSPIVFFLVMQAPAPSSSLPDPDQALLRVYHAVLLLHVLIIGLAGLAGNVRMFGLLVFLIGGRRVVWKVMAVWLAILGFVGCQLSWLLSPFLCKPTQTPHIFPREYFQQNFYERVWQAMKELKP